MHKLTQYDPFDELRALQRHLFDDNWLTPITSANMPTTDVYTTKDDKNLVVEAHLPNFNQDDIDIHIDEGSLVVRADKHERDEDKDKKYVVRESSSSFYRRVQLPQRADADKINAHMEDGILKITVPLTPLPQPKKITVKQKPDKKKK